MNDRLVTFGLRFGIALVILVLGLWLAGRARHWLAAMFARRGWDPMLGSFLSSIAHILLAAVVVIAALGQVGIQTSSLIAVIGAAGLAIGLAMQSSLANFAAGVMIIAFRPFRVGDFIEAAGVAGTVEGIEIFHTLLVTADNKLVIVPNGSITGGNITNYSARGIRRVDLTFSISYSDDIATAKAVLGEIVASDARVLKEPAPVIAVAALADSSVNLIVRPWVKMEDYWPVYWAITEAVKLRFDQKRITIPYPQRVVHTLPGRGLEGG
jgi:small conductance mechanosensitive channel